MLLLSVKIQTCLWLNAQIMSMGITTTTTAVVISSRINCIHFAPYSSPYDTATPNISFRRQRTLSLLQLLLYLFINAIIILFYSPSLDKIKESRSTSIAS